MKKYYFITYQGVRRDSDPHIGIWHKVIDVSPMDYRQKLIDSENSAEEKVELVFIVISILLIALVFLNKIMKNGKVIFNYGMGK